MAAFSLAKTLFVASLLVLVISSDATRVLEESASASWGNGEPCMKHKLMTETICQDICSKIGFTSQHFVSFTDVDPESTCCCCAEGKDCIIPPSPLD